MENLLVEVETKWFSHKFKNEPPKNFTQTQSKFPLEKITSLREEAKKLLDADIIYYNQFREKTRRSDHNWIRTVLNKGTIGDKISANCILIQDSVVHNLNSLQNLIASVKLSKKRECMLAIDALKDLFINYLLPSRELASFHQHPFAYLETLGDSKQRNKCLLLWYFESNLKAQYSNFIRALQLVFQDTLATSKFKVCSVLCDLIKSNPFEQEKFILEIVVNKLGDPDYQVASRVIFHLNNYLNKCPKMKLDVLNEVERLVTRQNINTRAQYYGFCCLNQFVLAKQDQAVANKLLIVYFSFFKKFVKNKEIDSRMLSALLTGVNRAYKFAKMENDELDNNLNTIFKLVHITSFNVSLQALMLLNQVVESREDMQNRYFNALYRKMFDLESKNTSKETFFLNLLYNSLIKDEALPRIRAFVKRLLQITFSQNPPFICGSFILISELLKTKKTIFQFDHSLLYSNQIGAEKESDDEEERFFDVKSDGESGEEEKEEPNKKNEKPNKAAGSWQHNKNVIFKKHVKYDFHERNPLYAGADKTLTYELLPFTRHYHPTVVVFANKLMNDEPVEYTGDPMEDFTLIHFLDRFVYKNPKKSKNNDDKPSKKSVFEPVKSIQKSNIRNLPINSKEYLNLEYKQIPEEEKIFYNYYKSQAVKKSKLNDEVDSEAESISDSEFDAYLNKTEVDGIDGKDDDLDLDFADALKSDKSKKKKKNKKANSGDSDSDDEELMDEFEDDDEFESAMNEDEEDDELEEFDDDEIEKIKTKKKRGKEDLSELFAAADEFSDLINESNKYDEMGVGSISNLDNANPRQLRWELDQDGFANDKIWKKNKNAKKFKGGKSVKNGSKSSIKKNNIGALKSSKKGFKVKNMKKNK